MENNNILKGVIYVALGASFYGMLATFVKIAYNSGYSTAEVTTAQFTIGILGLLLLLFIRKLVQKKPIAKASKNDILKLMLAGTSYGGTSLCYYLAVQYIDVSIAIVMLMQSVWFSVVVESVLNKRLPSVKKVFATIIVLVGTVLATNVINMETSIHPRGIFWGILAAISYTITMFTANKIATHLSPTKKSLYMLLGGSVIIISFLFFSQVGPTNFESIQLLYTEVTGKTPVVRPFNYSIFYTYGLFLAVFGTIIPPIFLNKGFPNAGLGLGSIVSSIELPVSVTMAYVLLNEKVMIIQWIGIAVILAAIVLMNWNKKIISGN
ncbi:MAG TPA: EamA family transporter [Brumimicrobium sp.]|nr:EamA family transporter [Brumimicrobium sp.]